MWLSSWCSAVRTFRLSSATRIRGGMRNLSGRWFCCRAEFRVRYPTKLRKVRHFRNTENPVCGKAKGCASYKKWMAPLRKPTHVRGWRAAHLTGRNRGEVQGGRIEQERANDRARK